MTARWVDPYINEDTRDLYFERGQAPWPRILASAKSWARQMGEEATVAVYKGIIQDGRVSDIHEYVHGDDDGCADSQDMEYEDPKFVPCCRSAVLYHFVMEEHY